MAGDIDGEGDVDIFVESGGGYNNPNPHFLINDGQGGFTLDASDERRSDALVWGPTGSFRYANHLLIDTNGDGHLDLVMGQLRRLNNDQEELASRVVLNDGEGNFLLANAVSLPYAEFNAGYTYAKALLAVDIDNDGDNDLVLSHERGNLDPDPLEEGNTGRFLQFLRNDRGVFVDDTEHRFGSQAATIPATDPTYGRNYNAPHHLEASDLDGDGDVDLFMGETCPVSDQAPNVYLQTNGTFEAEPAKLFTKNAWFGENAALIDADGDGRMDIIHSDLTVGPDGQFGTVDDVSELIVTLNRR